MKLRVPYGRGSAGRCDVIAKLIEILAQERHKAAGFLKVCSSILPFRTPRYRTLQTEIILSDNHEIETLKSNNKNSFFVCCIQFRGMPIGSHISQSALPCEIISSRVRWVSALQLTDEIRPEPPVPLPQFGGFHLT
jgi:hypothetical protein